jgi:hypothetical protein
MGYVPNGWDSIPGKGKKSFSIPQHEDRHWDPRSPYPMGAVGSSPRSKAARMWRWPLASISCVVKNRAIPTLPHTSSWRGAYLGTWGNFIFTLASNPWKLVTRKHSQINLPLAYQHLSLEYRLKTWGETGFILQRVSSHSLHFSYSSNHSLYREDRTDNNFSEVGGWVYNNLSKRESRKLFGAIA